ncbi:MAG TPA: hypothetical protein VMN57_03100 [Anaerolineales bacterium]|nr:hypothetical protein [Anaerolineales bacterium]
MTHPDLHPITAFISRWGPSGGAERSNYQLFLAELCDVLGVERPQPAAEIEADNAYVFEKSVPSRTAPPTPLTSTNAAASSWRPNRAATVRAAPTRPSPQKRFTAVKPPNAGPPSARPAPGTRSRSKLSLDNLIKHII